MEEQEEEDRRTAASANGRERVHTQEGVDRERKDEEKLLRQKEDESKGLLFYQSNGRTEKKKMRFQSIKIFI